MFGAREIDWHTGDGDDDEWEQFYYDGYSRGVSSCLFGGFFARGHRVSLGWMGLFYSLNRIETFDLKVCSFGVWVELHNDPGRRICYRQ